MSAPPPLQPPQRGASQSRQPINRYPATPFVSGSPRAGVQATSFASSGAFPSSSTSNPASGAPQHQNQPLPQQDNFNPLAPTPMQQRPGSVPPSPQGFQQNSQVQQQQNQQQFYTRNQGQGQNLNYQQQYQQQPQQQVSYGQPQQFPGTQQSYGTYEQGQNPQGSQNYGQNQQSQGQQGQARQVYQPQQPQQHFLQRPQSAQSMSPPTRTTTEEEQSLALKVMRLYKPRMTEAPLGLGLHGFQGRSWTQGPAGTLLLPSGLGKIYIGQTFSCYISVCNNGLCDAIHNVAIRAELEAGGTRHVLPDRREKDRQQQKVGGVGESSDVEAEPANGFKEVARPGDTIALVIDKELVNIGMHTLRVSVEFDSQSSPGSKRSIRKHYKFSVEKPISFSCLFSKVHTGTEEDALGAKKLLAQVTIKNLTDRDLLLPHLSLLPMLSGIQCRSLKLHEDEDELQQLPLDSPSGKVRSTRKIPVPRLIPPGGTHNELYEVEVVTPTDEAGAATAVTQIEPGASVARMFTRWRTDFAEQGRLQSQPLIWRPERPMQGVLLYLKQPLEPLRVGQPAQVHYVVSNASDASVNAQLRVDDDPEGSLLFTGMTTHALGELMPRQNRCGTFSVLPLRAGLHVVSCIRVIDARSAQPLLLAPSNNKLFVQS